MGLTHENTTHWWAQVKTYNTDARATLIASTVDVVTLDAMCCSSTLLSLAFPFVCVCGVLCIVYAMCLSVVSKADPLSISC